MVKEKEMEQGIKSLYGTFVFVGTPVFSEDKLYTSGKSEGGFVYHKVKFGLKTKDNNVLFVELSGGYNSLKNNIIYTVDNEGNKMEVNWMDRFNPTIIKSVSDMRKIKLNFETESENDSMAVLSQYDAVQEIKQNLSKDKRIVVVGNFKVEKYKDSNGIARSSMKYIPQKIRLAKEEEINKAELTLSFVFDKESWDESRLKSENIVDITAYTTYFDKTLTPNRNVFVQIPLVLDFNYLFESSAVHLTDEVKKIFVGLYKKYFTAKANQYFETQWKCDVIRGFDDKEITLDDLSPNQKLLIQFGRVTLEQLAKEMRNRVVGDKINEIRLNRPTLKYISEETEQPEVNKLTDYTDDDFYIPTIGTESLPIDEDEPVDEELLNRMFPIK